MAGLHRRPPRRLDAGEGRTGTGGIRAVGSDPPPAPNCGWVLVRESAFPDGIPACTSQRDAWKLALTAQKNGAYAAAFEPLTRSAARADILNEYETAAAQPAAVAKQLGRLVKHRLQK